MNIFNHYQDVIKKLLLDEKEKKNIFLPENLNSISVETPPKKFNCDFSTNFAMILSKVNEKSPMDIAENFKDLLLKLNDISEVSIVKPGFINVKLSKNFWSNFLEKILSNPSEYGVDNKEKKK